LNFRIQELPGRIQVTTDQPTIWTPETHFKGSWKYWSSGEQPASHSVWTTGAPMTALEYFQKLAAKITK
jgi:hypothetical protein